MDGAVKRDDRYIKDEHDVNKYFGSDTDKCNDNGVTNDNDNGNKNDNNEVVNDTDDDVNDDSDDNEYDFVCVDDTFDIRSLTEPKRLGLFKSTQYSQPLTDAFLIILQLLFYKYDTDVLSINYKSNEYGNYNAASHGHELYDIGYCRECKCDTHQCNIPIIYGIILNDCVANKFKEIYGFVRLHRLHMTICKRCFTPVIYRPHTNTCLLQVDYNDHNHACLMDENIQNDGESFINYINVMTKRNKYVHTCLDVMPDEYDHFRYE